MSSQHLEHVGTTDLGKGRTVLTMCLRCFSYACERRDRFIPPKKENLKLKVSADIAASTSPILIPASYASKSKFATSRWGMNQKRRKP